jgi:hypothetical protein
LKNYKLLEQGKNFFRMPYPTGFGKAKREWFAAFLRFANEIPVRYAFNRLFARLDPVSFRERFDKRPEIDPLCVTG